MSRITSRVRKSVSSTSTSVTSSLLEVWFQTGGSPVRLGTNAVAPSLRRTSRTPFSSGATPRQPLAVRRPARFEADEAGIVQHRPGCAGGRIQQIYARRPRERAPRERNAASAWRPARSEAVVAAAIEQQPSRAAVARDGEQVIAELVARRGIGDGRSITGHVVVPDTARLFGELMPGRLRDTLQISGEQLVLSVAAGAQVDDARHVGGELPAQRTQQAPALGADDAGVDVHRVGDARLQRLQRPQRHGTSRPDQFCRSLRDEPEGNGGGSDRRRHGLIEHHAGPDQRGHRGRSLLRPDVDNADADAIADQRKPRNAHRQNGGNGPYQTVEASDSRSGRISPHVCSLMPAAWWLFGPARLAANAAEVPPRAAI